MAHPDLYRSGNTTSPRFENVRLGKDVIVKDDKVGPNSGGVSTFSQKDAKWAAKTTWILQHTTPMIAGLTAHNDHGIHWLIAPDAEMPFETFKSHLETLNTHAVHYVAHVKEAHTVEAEMRVQVLATQSAHPDRATRFVYNALAAVARGDVGVPGGDWDENDRQYVAVLARAVEEGTLQLSALVWDPQAALGGWSRAKAFAARAVSAYMASEAADVKASGDEDGGADAANDHAYLRAILKLDDEGNPFSA
ncbi:hypothetical protein B0H11DRAFT_1835729, partial [Mycena galericulata]